VSGVGRGTGVFRWGGDCQRGKVSFGGKCRASHCNQWGVCGIVILGHGDGDAALLKLLWDFLLLLTTVTILSLASVKSRLVLVPAHSSNPRQSPESCKMDVVVVVVAVAVAVAVVVVLVTTYLTYLLVL